jgi:hypothetical protein
MSKGPFVNVAVFCDSTVLGNDNALSIIRIIDTVTTAAEGEDPPEQMPPFLFRTNLVVTLKAGEARGRYALKIRPEAPDGRQLEAKETAIQLDAGHTGVNVLTEVAFGIDQEGLWWFDVLFVAARGHETLLTRVPLRVVYEPQRTSAT